MGPLVWKVLGTGSAVLAASVAEKIVSKGWAIASGKPAPDHKVKVNPKAAGKSGGAAHMRSSNRGK